MPFRSAYGATGCQSYVLAFNWPVEVGSLQAHGLAVSVAPCTVAGTVGAGVDEGVLAVSGNVEVEQKVVPPAVAARLASVKARKEAVSSVAPRLFPSG